jgi:hypothetical protein
VPLPEFPLTRIDLLCALLKFYCAHPIVGQDQQFLAFLSVKSYSAVKDTIKAEFDGFPVPKLEKLRLLFLGPVTIDSNFRKVSVCARVNQVVFKCSQG